MEAPVWGIRLGPDPILFQALPRQNSGLNERASGSHGRSGIMTMKPKALRASAISAALLAGAFVLPGSAFALTLEQALNLAEQEAPSLDAQRANLEAARSAAIPAGELPDPKLKLGLQNVPIEGDQRWRLDEDFMTMQMVGVMQDCAESRQKGVHVSRRRSPMWRSPISNKLLSG